MDSKTNQNPFGEITLARLLKGAAKHKANLMGSLFSLYENLIFAQFICVDVSDFLITIKDSDYMALLLGKNFFDNANQVVVLLNQIKIDQSVTSIFIELRLLHENYAKDFTEVVGLITDPIKKMCGKRVNYIITDMADSNQERNSITILAFGNKQKLQSTFLPPALKGE